MFEQSAMNVFFIATCPAIGSGAGRRPSDRVHAPFILSLSLSLSVSLSMSVSLSLFVLKLSWELAVVATVSVHSSVCGIYNSHTHTDRQTKALPLNWAAVAPAQRCHIWFLLEAASEIGAFNVCLLPFTLTAPSARPLADHKSTRSAVDVSVYKLNISQTLTLECLF